MLVLELHILSVLPVNNLLCPKRHYLPYLGQSPHGGHSESVLNLLYGAWDLRKPGFQEYLPA